MSFISLRRSLAGSIAVRQSKFRNLPNHLSSLLGELDSQDKMFETETIHVLASLRSIVAVCVRDESEALGHTSLPVLCEEDSCDVTVSREQCAELVLFCQLGNLRVR